VDSGKRKSEILSALASLAREQAIKIRIETTLEAEARIQREARHSEGEKGVQAVSLEGIAATNTIPVDREVRRYLQSRGVTERQLDEEVNRLSNRMLSRSHQVLLHAFAMKNLVERFSPDDLRSLIPEARAKWLGLIAMHARAFQREAIVTRRELAAIFGAADSVDEDNAGSLDVSDDAALLLAISRLTKLASSINQSIESAFTISSANKSVNIRTPQFWSALNSAEQLASRIGAVAR
jgi:hypothetical protein